MKPFGSIESFLWALVLVLLAFICTGNSFKKELWLYDSQDNAIQFQAQVADTSDFSSFLANVTRVCTRGHWRFFRAENFKTYYSEQGSLSSSGIFCRNFPTASFVKSLRHFGANDTDTDALSLYEGDDGWNYSGKEVFVTARAHTGITNKIIGIAATGTSDWMLFEGLNLDGISRCFQVPFSGYYFNWDAVSSLNLKTVGSVFKGCDAPEIRKYKMLNKSSFVTSN